MPDPHQLTVGSLFAGIGGFDLGFERAGMRTVWFCEQDPYCRAVLAKHWPGVPCHPDVRALVADAPRAGREARCSDRLRDDARRGQGFASCASSSSTSGVLRVPVPPVDVLCGGFPCQDLSSAGRQAGLAGERSGLWFEFLRLIGELRPSYVVVENVPQLRKYLGTVTGGLAEIGYDAEWDIISAADFGAPHLRKRLWLVAYPQRDELREQPRRRRGADGAGAPLAAGDGEARPLADACSQGLEGYERRAGQPQVAEPRFGGAPLADATRSGRGARSDAELPESCRGRRPADRGWWESEPDVGRVANGVPARVDRLRALGNALVPQIAEYIGRQIVSAHA